MFETDLAYAAGIIDGEGCIHIRQAVIRSTGVLRYGMECQVAMTDRRVVEWLHEYFSGSIHHHKFGVPWRKDQWVWLVAARKAQSFLQQVLPYLKLKREQAILALELQNRICSRNGLVTRLDGRYILSLEEIVARQVIYNKVRNLNGKGVNNNF